MSDNSLISEALAQLPDAVFHHVAVRLTEAFPDLYLLETQSHFFLPTRFASGGLCKMRPHPDHLTEFDWHWDASHKEYSYPYNGWFDVCWEGHEMQIVAIGRQEAHCRVIRQYLLAPDEQVARAFYREVCKWNAEVRGEVLVFDQGRWYKSSDLYESIQSASFDNLILAGNLKEEIQRDISGFFEAEATYRQYGIAWKRGVLLLGPPGNGKTHSVKSVINSLGKPCLYVKSFTSEYKTDQDNIGAVFERARETAPCILVLEDLDSLLTRANRSFFLNEMDGFASNDGILTLATTNHPERLDPAILERPSRFDRKYTFNLPQPSERVRYLEMFSSRLQSELRLTLAGLANVSSATEGYSFAYLKELYVSSMMRWIAAPGETQMDQLMVEQSEILRAQMSQEAEMPELFSADEDENVGSPMSQMMKAMQRARARR
jgi:AAA+ superfamily predicted ATPase